jgi:LuxR family maltose regulon positive regulatory protein
LIPRTRLFRVLSGTRPGAVSLVCAPAGSGKTVLLRSWVEAEGLSQQVAWLAVDRGEHDPQRFWLSVVNELASAGPASGRIHRPAPSPDFRGGAMVEGLLGDLWSLENRVVLVIDDLHELRSAEALELLELFLSELPPYVTVVLSTRQDPRLGLHRLRLTGRLTEIRAGDLRFSRDETEALLREAGVDLSDADVSVLQGRAEGWAAGLRLASISLSRHPDPERFVREFSGSERTVAGYLMAEVLEHQPAEVRELLLRTSMLERVSGPVADFLTGGSGSERMFQELEDANAFVTSLDVGRSWFRYHHLFADLLQLELRRVAPATIGPLHRAAAQWYGEHVYVVEAVRHAQAARDWALASRLLADNHLDLTFDGRSQTVSELLSAFPSDVAAADPELALVFATVCLLHGDLDESAAYVDLAERTADVVSQDRTAGFELYLAVLRLVLARWRGDLETVFEAKPLVEAGLAAQPAGGRGLRVEYRCVALQNIGVAELWSSRVDDARRHLEEALVLARQAPRPWLQIAPLGHLGIAVAWSGQPFTVGLRLSEEAVRIADTHGWPEDPVILTALATGAMALLWLGRFEEAERWLERAQRTLHPDGEPASELIVHDARGLLHLARGRLDEALAAFRAAERMQALLASKHPFALAGRARILQTQARMGQLTAARAALAEISEDDRDLTNFRVAAAVIDLARGEPEHAVDVLAPVIEGTAPAIHRASATAEAQVLYAVARDQLGDARAVEASIERALSVAEPEGLVLPFALAPVQALLERHRHRTAHTTLLAAILDMLAGRAPPPEGAAAALRDELSEAELRVLRYLPGNMKAPEIASELFVSNNTVRTHLRHIYAKLDAHTRSEAVARARQLRLIGPSSGAL